MRNAFFHATGLCKHILHCENTRFINMDASWQEWSSAQLSASLICKSNSLSLERWGLPSTLKLRFQSGSCNCTDWIFWACRATRGCSGLFPSAVQTVACDLIIVITAVIPLDSCSVLAHKQWRHVDTRHVETDQQCVAWVSECEGRHTNKPGLYSAQQFIEELHIFLELVMNQLV